MKLIQKTTRYYLLTFLSVMILNTIVLFFLIRFFIYQRIDQTLIKEKKIVEQILQESDKLPEFLVLGEIEVLITPLEGQTKNVGINQFISLDHYSKNNEEILPFRQLSTTLSTPNGFFELVIRHSLVRSQELIFSIILSSFLSIGLFFFGLVLINRKINRKLWAPFYDTLQKLKAYGLNDSKNIDFPTSDTKEFEELNQELQLLTDKIQQDYQHQKSFMENASHELQTPLAVIRTQLELLLQTEGLKKLNVEQVASALDAADKLAKINKSLVLLSRIENMQFAEVLSISLNTLIKKNLRIFTPEIKSKEITVELVENEVLQIEMNELLADMLIKNLIQNAVRHNLEKGKIFIAIEKGQFEITNLGAEPEVPTQKLFERFYKYSDSEHSTGLGLSIVKEICDLYEYEIDYSYLDKIHKVRLFF